MKSPVKIRILLSGALLWLAIASNAASPGWSLIWSDEFNQPDNSSPSTNKWSFETGGSGFGNNELEYYTTRTNNARIVGGMLIIQAEKENFGGRNYTSARMTTKSNMWWTYGRMEARIKIPRGQGIWPAFWMLGTNISSVGWPTCGEIDIMENIGREPTLVHGTAHGPGYSGGNGIGGPCQLPGNLTYADDFHTYAVEWVTNQIKWFVDGKQYFSVNPGSLPGGATWVYTAPQYILLNLAVGGNWPGNPDTNTVFPQQMIVDYVRVYAPTNLPDTKSNLLSNAGFETSGFANWAAFGAGFNTIQETANHVSVRNGTNVFKVFGQFNGSVNSSGVYQDVPVSPGQSFAARGWMFTAIDDQIAGANRAWVEVTFRDASANILTMYRSTPVTTNTPPGLWLSFPVTNQVNPANGAFISAVSNLVAPANTTFARYAAVFLQPGLSNGAVYFDDLRLTASGTVTIPVTVSAVHSGGNVNLAFGTYLNLSYEVYCKSLLNDANWTVLTNLPGTGTNLVVTVSPQTPVQFFQVSRVCN